MELTHIATRAERLSVILKEDMGISSGLMNRLKWQQRLLVNGVPRHTDFPIQQGDTVSALLPGHRANYPAEQGVLSVLYEDDCLLAVDKPAGMLIHPSRSCNTGTLANLVLGYYEGTGQACAFHPVTRLDRDTFGIVLLAKSPHIHAKMQAVPLKKTYHALVLGGPAEDSGQIDAPIARHPLPSLLRYVSPQGKPCTTVFSVLERWTDRCKLELQPITGRTHQLRVHCAHMGFPIVGDPQYGTADPQYAGQQLCAKSLEFLHPLTGQLLHLSSPMDVPESK